VANLSLEPGTLDIVSIIQEGMKTGRAIMVEFTVQRK
jgi:hypothetical protein